MILFLSTTLYQALSKSKSFLLLHFNWMPCCCLWINGKELCFASANLVSNPSFQWSSSTAANHLSPQTSPYFLYVGCFFRNLLRIKKYLSHNTHTQTHTLAIDKDRNYDRNSHFLVNLSPFIDHLWGSCLVQLSSPLTNILNFPWVEKPVLLEDRRWCS